MWARNYKLLLQLTLIMRHICTFCQQRKFVCVIFINNWTCFWNKYCDLSFLAICWSLLPLLTCVILISKSKNWAENEPTKQKKMWLIVILKDFIKQPVIKQSPTVLQLLLSHWLLHSCFFLSLSKRLQILKNWQDFIGKLSLYIKMEKIWKYW